MSMSDPLADMLTRLRNGMKARHPFVLVPASRLKYAIARILKEEGFIRDVELLRDTPQRTMKIWLKYSATKEPVISGLRRVSKPGLRVYVGKREVPYVLNGLGLAILSTPQGVVTDRKARQLGVGGEVLCYIW